MPSCGFKHENYVFIGWNTKKDGTGTTYTNGASIKNLTSVNKKTITLYAMWGVERPSISEVQKDSYSSQEIHINTVDDADGYEIYRSTSSKGKYKKVGTTGYSTFIDENLKANTKYYYKIQAYATNSEGNKIYSDYSKVVTGVTAKKPNFNAYVDANFGDYVSIVYLHIDNKGDERFVVGGDRFSNFCHYYPYEGTGYTKGTLVNRNFREVTGVYTEGGENGYCMFVLDFEGYV